MRLPVIFALSVAACGPTAADNFGNGTDAGDNGGGGGGGGGGGSGGGSNCASTSVTAQVSPLDIFMMLDQSTSMDESVSGGGTKWAAVTGAMDTFLSQPNLSGFSAGIGYFGNSQFSDSCNASTYAAPAVEIAALPGASASLKTSISGHGPSTGTPTIAALGGAISHAQTWATAHPNDITAVVFATDGEPSECDTVQSHINKIASDAYAGTPKIATFVIGVGDSLTSLNSLAAAGGTT
ncbi:MAG TPA: VWA domain-containing protein, partial [Kofleriaceae bacterium]